MATKPPSENCQHSVGVNHHSFIPSCPAHLGKIACHTKYKITPWNFIIPNYILVCVVIDSECLVRLKKIVLILTRPQVFQTGRLSFPPRVSSMCRILYPPFSFGPQFGSFVNSIFICPDVACMVGIFVFIYLKISSLISSYIKKKVIFLLYFF